MRKTGRAVIVHEAPRSFGPGAEIAASIMEGAFLSLEAPIRARDRVRRALPGLRPREGATSRRGPRAGRGAARRSPSELSDGPRQFVLPDLGEGLTEAEISPVLVREGDVIREDAPLLEVETDKAQVEIPSPIGGRVEKIHVRPGPDA